MIQKFTVMLRLPDYIAPNEPQGFRLFSGRYIDLETAIECARGHYAGIEDIRDLADIWIMAAFVGDCVMSDESIAEVS